MNLEDISLGFMQGRLAPQLLARVQTFPFGYWKDELYLAARMGFSNVEWTIDSPTILLNPILTLEGQSQIRLECRKFKIEMNSITCDFFMENPPWKNSRISSKALKDIFEKLFRATEKLGKLILVVPLVDNSSLTSILDFDKVINFFYDCNLEQYPVCIAFECSLEPQLLSKVFVDLPNSFFGINLDIGNSASLGFDAVTEIGLLGRRIVNIHLKDRLLGGNSVRFGTGDADFHKYFELLLEMNYQGNLILQSYRPKQDYISELVYSKKYSHSVIETLV